MFGTNINWTTCKKLQTKNRCNINNYTTTSPFIFANVFKTKKCTTSYCRLKKKKNNNNRLLVFFLKIFVLLTQLIAISFSQISSFITPALLITMSSTLNFSIAALNAARKTKKKKR